jgi:hypothetical protein
MGLTVSVRDAQTQEPIRNAVVRVEPQRPVHPLDVSAILFGSEPPPSDSGFTGPDGRVTLKAFAGLPMNIAVGAAGYGLETYFFPDHPVHTAKGLWRSGQSPAGDESAQGGRRLEAKFE